MRLSSDQSELPYEAADGRLLALGQRAVGMLSAVLWQDQVVDGLKRVHLVEGHVAALLFHVLAAKPKFPFLDGEVKFLLHGGERLIILFSSPAARRGHQRG